MVECYTSIEEFHQYSITHRTKADQIPDVAAAIRHFLDDYTPGDLVTPEVIIVVSPERETK